MSTSTGNRGQRTAHVPPISTQEEMEAVHKGAWVAWLKSLTPDERADLEGRGIKGDGIEARRRGRPREARADKGEGLSLGNFDHLAGEVPDPAAAMMAKEAAAHEARRKAGSKAEAKRLGTLEADTDGDLRVLSFVLPVIADVDDVRLELCVIAFAVGIGFRQGLVPTAVAQRHGITEAEFSDRVAAWKEKLTLSGASLRLLRYVISPMLASSHPRLEADAIAAAARVHLRQGVSQTRLAKRYGLTRASISQRIRRWVARLGVPLPPGCKQNTEQFKFSNVRPTSRPADLD